jgi:hypothetical protein
MKPDAAPPTAEWSWGDLFSLDVPAALAVTDEGHAVELVPAHPDTGEPDDREASRAWLTVLSPDASAPTPAPDPWDAAPEAITRFAASVGVALTLPDVHRVLDRGVTWARADFDAPTGRWQAIAIAWNAHVALFLVSAADPAFLGAVDALIASWRPLAPVIVPASRPALSDDDGF